MEKWLQFPCDGYNFFTLYSFVSSICTCKL